MTDRMIAARAALHYWEEPCLSGTEGSGAVFFSGCNLQCVYCQNAGISRAESGVEISEERLTDIFLSLQEQGANNINLVTGVHFLPGIRASLQKAKARGLRIPVVYNSSGYERAEILREMEGWIDIYLPDFKYLDPSLGVRYSRCSDYPEHAKQALAEMVRQCPRPRFDEQGKMTRGVIVRHLALPTCGRDSKRVLRYLHDTFGEQIFISILRQYTPMPHIQETAPELDRRVTEEEYERIVNFAMRIGIVQGFVQENDTASESFIPDFNGEGLREDTVSLKNVEEIQNQFIVSSEKALVQMKRE